MIIAKGYKTITMLSLMTVRLGIKKFIIVIFISML